MYKIHNIFTGFSGKLENVALGWGSIALLQSEEQNILIDTGSIGIRAHLPNLLSKYKLTVKDIDVVLLTHLHFDHAGNVSLFPKAKFIVGEEEWYYAHKQQVKDLYIENGNLFFLSNADLYLIDRNGEIPFLPKIKAMHTPGHTPGSISYIYSEGNINYMFVGDAVKNRGELVSGRVQMSLNSETSQNSIKKIKQSCDWLLPGHDNWLHLKDGELIEQKENYKVLLYGEGLTINNGKKKIILSMDSITG
ncbi:Metallo-beta-lactamase superfamily [Peptoniphilus sp. ING2-D1G]|nr:Metallo-beta-lactamase superfamily [Peptoniphilus sp. ING2-D1G]